MVVVVLQLKSLLKPSNLELMCSNSGVVDGQTVEYFKN